MRLIHPSIFSYASKFRWLAQVWTCEVWKSQFWRVVQMVCGCSFWGWEPACLPCCFSTNVSRADLRDQCQELISETSVVSPFHCCSYTFLCPFPGSVRARQDCSSAYALSKREHVADNNNAVTEHSKLFWFITISVSPLSTYKCSRKNCNFFESVGKKKLKYGISETWRLQTKWDTLYNCAEKAALKITMITPESDPALGWLF